MKAFRIAAAAVAIAIIGGMQNESQAGQWVVRVELENAFKGPSNFPVVTTIYATIYSSSNKQSAEFVYFWEQVLLAYAPDEFLEGISDLIPSTGNWIPRRLLLVYLPDINVIGRR